MAEAAPAHDARAAAHSEQQQTIESSKSAVTEVLTNALELARVAVKQDELQAAPEKVLICYENAIRAIDSAVSLLPASVVEQTGILQHRCGYS